MMFKELILISATTLLAVNAELEYQKLVKFSNEFGFDFLRLIPFDENAFFSPASIYTALGMLYAGAHGPTTEDMDCALDFNNANFTSKSIHESFADLYRRLKTPKEYTLETANALLYKRLTGNNKLVPNFETTLKNNYNAILKDIHFRGCQKKDIQKINAWAKNKTNNNIPVLTGNLPRDSIMVLLNAIYFKGFWEKPFYANYSKTDIFYNYGEYPINIAMRHTKGSFPTVTLQDEGLQAIELPFKGGNISMVILLPLWNGSVTEIENMLDTENFQSIISKLKLSKSDMLVSIPRLYSEEQFRKLNDYLYRLGLGNLFEEGADFSKITTKENLHVTEISHAVIFDMGEDERTPSKSGIIGINGVETFSADKPFLYFIRDRKTNLILFAGRMTSY